MLTGLMTKQNLVMDCTHMVLGQPPHVRVGMKRNLVGKQDIARIQENGQDTLINVDRKVI